MLAQNTSVRAELKLPAGVATTAKAMVPNLEEGISKLQTTNKDRHQEAVSYAFLAIALKRLEDPRPIEEDIAVRMTKFLHGYLTAPNPGEGVAFNEEAYDKLLWFSHSWKELESLRQQAKYIDALDLVKQLIHCQHTWKFIRHTSLLWIIQKHCELILGDRLEAYHSHLAVLACKSREKTTRAAGNLEAAWTGA